MLGWDKNVVHSSSTHAGSFRVLATEPSTQAEQETFRHGSHRGNTMSTVSATEVHR